MIDSLEKLNISKDGQNYILHCPKDTRLNASIKIEKDTKFFLSSCDNCKLNFEFKVSHGANFKVEVLSLADKKAEQDIKFKMDISDRGTKAQLRSLSILKDEAERKAHLNCVVQKGAVSAFAKEVDEVVIFGNDAKNTSIPEVSIHENDSSCEHSLHCSRLEQAKLEYLRSRGLTQNKAQLLCLKNRVSPELQGRLLDFFKAKD